MTLVFCVGELCHWFLWNSEGIVELCCLCFNREVSCLEGMECFRALFDRMMDLRYLVLSSMMAVAAVIEGRCVEEWGGLIKRDCSCLLRWNICWRNAEVCAERNVVMRALNLGCLSWSGMLDESRALAVKLMHCELKWLDMMWFGIEKGVGCLFWEISCQIGRAHV